MGGSMNQLTTTAIVLARTDYGEADRILTVLTPDYGKLRLMAKGVRRVKSRLAGGIELFSVSHMSFVRGRGDLGTLVSARLMRHYSCIVADIGRVQLGYDLIKLLNKITEDAVEPEYFNLLEQAFQALDDVVINGDLVRLWFSAQLLRLGGHSPNLQTDTTGQKLLPEKVYDFDYQTMAFAASKSGNFAARHIKLLRLLFASISPKTVQKIDGSLILEHELRSLMEALRREAIGA